MAKINPIQWGPIEVHHIDLGSKLGCRELKGAGVQPHQEHSSVARICGEAPGS